MLIGWRDGNDVLHHGSLFGVFAALARGDAWSFPALRPHQREPWHAFTVQVAALALIRAERDDLPADEATWRDLLLASLPACLPCIRGDRPPHVIGHTKLGAAPPHTRG